MTAFRLLTFVLVVVAAPLIGGFVIQGVGSGRQSPIPISSPTAKTTSALKASLASRQYTRDGRRGRGGGGSGNYHRDNQRSKRQERVGQLVQTELSRILHTGIIRGDSEYLEDDLRQRISVVSADVSPDLRQARISVSIRGPNKRSGGGGGEASMVNEHQEEDEDDELEDDDDDEYYYDDDEEDMHNPAVDKRRAYAWLVRNTKPIRHTLAQRMSHIKASAPNLSFVQVDVAAATDVMYLIDKVAAGYKRERIGGYNENDMPTGILSGIDFDEDYDEDEWDEEEDSKFFAK